MKYKIGVDLGGTNIKVGIVDDTCRILAQSDCPTALPRPAEAVCDDLLKACSTILEQKNLSWSDITGVGIGCPGTVNSSTGIVEYSNNLGWRTFPMCDYLQSRIGKPVRIGNDANVAALGEVCAGSAKGAQSAVILTLGTGVGSGVVMNAQIWSGHCCGAAEFGHMVIEQGGRLCTCGRRGCLEAYASATALIAFTKEAIDRSPESLMNRIAAENGKIDGRTAFDAMKKGDSAAEEVVETYLDYLACGVANIINILQPEIISLGGGISKEGDALLIPLREKAYAQVFGGCDASVTRIEACTLGNQAGMIGAAMLFQQKSELAGR